MRDLSRYLSFEINKMLLPESENSLSKKAIYHSVRYSGEQNQATYYSVAFGALGSLKEEGFENYPAPKMWCEYLLKCNKNGSYEIKSIDYDIDKEVQYPFDLPQAEFLDKTKELIQNAFIKTQMVLKEEGFRESLKNKGGR